jgi:hypothetical protein
MLGTLDLGNHVVYQIPQRADAIDYKQDVVDYVRRDGTYAVAKTKAAGVEIRLQVRCAGGISRQAAESARDAIRAQLTQAINHDVPGQGAIYYTYQFDDMTSARRFQILTGVIEHERFDEANTNTLICDLLMKGNEL